MPQPKQERAPQAPSALPGQRRRVLVLDDHPTVRSVVGRVLHEHGYETVNAASVDEAVRLLTTTPVIAIILDVKLSGGRSGLELLERIQAHALLAPIPTVVMTGVALSDEEKQHIEDHQAHVLYKPEGLTALVGFLHQISDTDASADS